MRSPQLGLDCMPIQSVTVSALLFERPDRRLNESSFDRQDL